MHRLILVFAFQTNRIEAFVNEGQKYRFYCHNTWVVVKRHSTICHEGGFKFEKNRVERIGNHFPIRWLNDLGT